MHSGFQQIGGDEAGKAARGAAVHLVTSPDGPAAFSRISAVELQSSSRAKISAKQLVVGALLFSVFFQGVLVGVGAFVANPKTQFAANKSERVASIIDDQVRAGLNLNNLPAPSAEELALPKSDALADAPTEEVPSPALDTARPTERGTVEPQLQRYKVVSGDTISKIWTKHGASYASSLRAAEALKALEINGAALRAGEEIALQLDEEGKIILMKRSTKGGDTIELRLIDGNYEAKIIKTEVISLERTVSGIITSSFIEAARGDGLPFDVVDDLVDIFGPRVDFRRQLQPGDTYTVVFNERRSTNGEYLGAGPIAAAAIVNSGAMLSAVRHVGSNGQEAFYDERGQAIGDYFLRYPLKFTRISSVFTTSRFHPVLGVKRPHNGVDFAAPIGTPVRSVGDGRIEIASARGGAGLMVMVRHNERYSTAYMHLSKISQGMRPGAIVKRGEVIGNVGMTGLATGPHLHFSLYDRGTYIDPMNAKLPQLVSGSQVIPQAVLLASIKRLQAAQPMVTLAAADLFSAGKPLA